MKRMIMLIGGKKAKKNYPIFDQLAFCSDHHSTVMSYKKYNGIN
ncbi:MAG: hypothetical protein V1874_11055 [Spirochaetota bacterium]